MKKTVLLVLASLFLSIFIGFGNVYSEEMGSLTIKYKRKDTDRGVAGVEMTIYKVADISGNSYVLTSPFGASGVLVNELSTADSKNRAAATLFRYAAENGINGSSTVTDELGNAYFNNLTQGIYLAAQTRAISGFKTILPYLVYIPGKTITGRPIYNVLSNVKTERDSSGGGGGGGNNCSVSVMKIWDDGNNADGIRPQSVGVDLLRNGKKYSTVFLSAENGWKYTFSGLPGSARSYTVEESEVEGYTASYSGSAADKFVITNYHKAQTPTVPSSTSVLVQKKWEDDNNKNGLRPNNVTIQLIRNGTVYKTAQLDNSNNWRYSFDDLPDDDYTVKEISTYGYHTSYSRVNGNVYTVINTLGEGEDDPPLNPVDPSVMDIPVYKVWNDNDNEAGKRPQSVTVNLIKDGSIYRSLSLTSENGWKGVFSGVPSNGAYSIIEDAVMGYTAEYTADGEFVVTNTYTGDKTDPGVPPDSFVDGIGEEMPDNNGNFYDKPVSIPQTGSLNWPIPVLGILGVVFLALGFLFLPVNRRNK